MTSTAQASVPVFGMLSTLFDHRGAILFQTEAARQDFAAPNETKRVTCAFVSHFVNRAEGRRLFDAAAAGHPAQAETRVHTRGGIVRRVVEISPAAGPDETAGIMLNERPPEPNRTANHHAELARIFAQAGADWLWETDTDLRIALVSDRPDLRETSASGDFIGRVIYQPLPGIDDLDYAGLRDVTERRMFFRDFRYTRYDRQGRRRHFSVSGTPFFDNDGVFRGYRGTGVDRTQSVEAEEQAAVARARLIAAIESIPEAFILFDRDNRLVMCNSRFREENPAIADRLRAGTPVAELVVAARRAGLTVPAIDYIAEAKGDGPGRGAIERQSGNRWFQLGARRLPEGGHAVVQTDVTALRRREAELAEKSALLQATLDNMHQGVLVNDADARVVMWNDRFLEMNGLRPDAIRAGMPASALVRAAAKLGEYGAGDVSVMTARRLDQIGGGTADSARIRPNGSVIEHHTNRMPGGMVIRTFTDITQLKEHERRGEDQRRLLAATLGNMDQGILVLDADLRVRLWNPRMLDLLRISPDICHVGLPLADLIAAMLRHHGLPATDLAATVTARLKDFGRSNVITLSPENFGGRTIERRRRPLPDGGMVLTYTDITEAKEREREIAEKSELLAATLESMDQGIMVVGADRGIRMWNSRVIEQHALPEDFLRVGMPASEVVMQLARQGEYGAGNPGSIGRERLAMLRDEYGTVFERRHSSGAFIERRRRPMPDGGIVLTYTDVTDLTEHERALEEKTTHLTAVLASMDQGMLVLDQHTNIRTWNQRAVDLLNLPPNSLRVGMPAVEMIRLIDERKGESPAEIARSIATRLDEFLGGAPRLIDGPTLDGRVIERHSLPMPDGGLIVIYNDVTERKRRDDVITENSALLSATLDNMDQGLVVIDSAHRAKLWNNRLIEMFKLPPDVMRVGRPFRDVMRYFIESAGTPADQVEERLAERMVELEGEPMPVLDRHRADGRVIERRRRVMPQGGSVITYGDVTARKRGEVALRHAKEEAEIASRSKTEFLANMSHELRTPLNAIIGFSDILARQLFGPLGQDRYTEYAKDIHDSGQHLLSLINDVLDISKIEVNKIDLAVEPIDVPAAIDSCLRLMRDRATAAGVTIGVKMPDTLPPFVGDDRRVKQILLNLVSNAVKFTPAGGQVEIRVEADDDGFSLVVADTGIGIAKSDIETALRPFGQIDSSLARSYQGTGLGLPLARSMAELHGGRLDIESEPGKGTTVTVRLPAKHRAD